MPKSSKAKKPAVKKPAVKKLAAKKPVAKKPAVKKPTAKKPAVKNLTAHKTNGNKRPSPKRANASGYVPSESERYMSSRQISYFKAALEKSRRDILTSAERMIDTMKDEMNIISDENDRASKESEFAVELRERERERRLLHKINSTIRKTERKEFGYCEECGEPIGIKRLLARPVASLCYECKNLQEEFEKNGDAMPHSNVQ